MQIDSKAWQRVGSAQGSGVRCAIKQLRCVNLPRDLSQSLFIIHLFITIVTDILFVTSSSSAAASPDSSSSKQPSNQIHILHPPPLTCCLSSAYYYSSSTHEHDTYHTSDASTSSLHCIYYQSFLASSLPQRHPQKSIPTNKERLVFTLARVRPETLPGISNSHLTVSLSSRHKYRPAKPNTETINIVTHQTNNQPPRCIHLPSQSYPLSASSAPSQQMPHQYQCLCPSSLEPTPSPLLLLHQSSSRSAKTIS